MHFSTLFTASSLALTTLAHPYSPASGNTFEAQLLKRQDAGTVITSGANGLGDGNTHARLEVSDLAANHPYQWALYILTMAKWEQTAQTDATGYFGISSIHGVPRTSWDGVEACDSCDGADGYCTHDSVLFPAWHRAYLALYEQEFLNAATEVANGLAAGAFKDSIVNGLATLRIPYWDWAANPDGANTLPTIISSPQITIAGPDGQQTVDNPLYSYAFTDASGMYYSPFTNWDNTLRYPNSNANGATSQEQQAVDAFNNVRENVQDQIYSLLTQCDDYLHFATDDASSSAPSCANSLEGIHNTIHTAAGGAGSKDVSGGHMTYLPLASFDPIFWLHHANVDRIFALWQTVHPDVYGASQTAPHNTWTIASGSEQNADSPLKPFRKDANTWWTTNDVKDWAATFKYTYPEFEDSDGSSSAIINYVNKLYGQNPTLTAGSVSKNVEKNGSGAQSSSTSSAVPTTSVEARDRSPSTTASTSTAQGYGIGIGLGPISLSIGLPFGPGNAAPTATASNGFPQLGGFGPGAWNGTATRTGPSPTGTGSSSGPGNTEVDPTFLAPNGSMYQYQCNIHTPRYAFDGSYSIYVFDGQPSNNDSSNWLGDKNCVGTIGVLAGGEMANKDLLISGSVPITRHLQRQYKAGKLDGMAETYVVPYMAKNLNWKIVYNGEEVHPNALSGFKSSFFSGTSSLAGDGILPKWSSLIPEIDVTLGKAGGVQQIADAIGDTIGDVTSAIGGLLPTGYGSSPASTDSPEYAPSATKPSTEAPEATEAPASPAAPEEYEETVTILTTVYTTVCPCKASATAPAY